MDFQLGQLILFLVILQGTQSLKSLVIKVPEYVKVNETVTLACEYDLEDVALYTIKWYWNGIEFYRFVPKESPPSKAFSIPNFNVDITKSGANEVTLRNVQKDLSGLFKCEVSADAPLFHTELKGAIMNIIDVPSGTPHIEAKPKKVEIGKKVTAICTMNATQATLNVTWSINNQLVDSLGPDIRIRRATLNGIGTAIESDIEVTALKSYFNMGPMVIRCDVSLFNIWTSFTEALVLEEVPLLAPVLLSTSSQTREEDNFDFFASSNDRVTPSIFIWLICYITYIFIR